MPMDQNEIERLIKDALPDAEVLVEDLAGDGDHYAARVVSSAFKGKTRVQFAPRYSSRSDGAVEPHIKLVQAGSERSACRWRPTIA